MSNPTAARLVLFLLTLLLCLVALNLVAASLVVIKLGQYSEALQNLSLVLVFGALVAWTRRT